MTRTYARVLATIWFLAWVPLATSLLPLPAERAQRSIAEAEKLNAELKTLPRPPRGSDAAKAVTEHEARIERWKRNPAELEARFWTDWGFALAQLLLGVLGSILLFIQNRTWLAIGAISTGWYLLGHHFGIFFVGTSSLADAIARIQALAILPSTLLTILHFELLLPLVCGWILVMAVVVWNKSRDGHGNIVRSNT